MKYFAKLYGPYGPNQMGEEVIYSWDTPEEREKYLSDLELAQLMSTWEGEKDDWKS